VGVEAAEPAGVCCGTAARFVSDLCCLQINALIEPAICNAPCGLQVREHRHGVLSMHACC
jgi:hypothetical protein